MEEQMWFDINHIDKKKFLILYSAAHKKALNESNIKSDFRATELVLYDSEQILSCLNIQMHTPSHPGTSHSSQAFWATATPHNVQQLEQQTEKVMTYFRCHMHSSFSPIN
ncbi:hypothetical protein I7I48_08511 [Histoplasma ohiense]|nr:hypothetical protein I7I48_08511 [Histoplasma ohiense (nom. inval.)]